MLVSFDIDCGFLVAGHRFIARGISDDGLLSEFTGDPYPCISLEYELVPGVESAEAAGNIFPFLVGIEYETDAPLPWVPSDGGAIAPFVGGQSTHGSRGSWPLPREARFLRFTLRGVDEQTGWPREAPDGVLVVDLQGFNAVFQGT